MKTTAEFIIGSLLFVLFLATILKELKFFGNFWDSFPVIAHYIPSWSFFAPNPYQVDYYVLYRNINQNEVHEWKQIYQYKKMRPSYSFFWNPHKLFLRAIVDVSIDLLKVASNEKDKKRICLSLPYLYLLNYVHHLSDSQMEKFQFIIMTKDTQSEPEVVFVSETHPIKL